MKLIKDGDIVRDEVKDVMDRTEDADIDVTDNTNRVHEMIIRKQTGYTENRLFPQLTLDDFRLDLIERVQKADVNMNKSDALKDLSPLEVLQALDLYETDVQGRTGFNLAAVLLFGKDVTIRTYVAYWRMDCLVNIKDRERYDDRLDISTNLIETLDQTLAFIKKTLPSPFYMEGVTRKDALLILWREIIVNMLSHREWSHGLHNIITITPEMITATNPNKPYRPRIITKPERAPYAKNPKVARVFKILGDIEEVGSGMGKIFHLGEFLYGYNPAIKNEDVYAVELPRVHEEEKIQNEQKELTRLEKDILEFIYNQRKATTKQISDQFGISVRWARELLKNLLEFELVEWHGTSPTDKTQYYTVK